VQQFLFAGNVVLLTGKCILKIKGKVIPLEFRL